MESKFGIALREDASPSAAILPYFIFVPPPLSRWSFDLNDGCLSGPPERGFPRHAMAREEFDHDLQQLEAELVLLGALVESSIFNALNAIKNRDLVLSEKVIQDDDLIDDKRHLVEDACTDLIRREAPVASDLRRIISALHIAGELERMGDYAEGIAKISLMMGPEPPLKELVDIPAMGERAVHMLKQSLDAFLTRNEIAAREEALAIGPDDDEVDDLYRKVRVDLLSLMKADPANVERGTYLLWAAHNVERIADRATNIAERVVYQATGDRVRVGAGKEERVFETPG